MRRANYRILFGISAAIMVAAILINVFLGEFSGADASGDAPIVWLLLGIIALSTGTAAWSLGHTGWVTFRRTPYRGGILILIVAILLALGAWVNALRLFFF